MFPGLGCVCGGNPATFIPGKVTEHKGGTPGLPEIDDI